MGGVGGTKRRITRFSPILEMVSFSTCSTWPRRSLADRLIAGVLPGWAGPPAGHGPTTADVVRTTCIGVRSDARVTHSRALGVRFETFGEPQPHVQSCRAACAADAPCSSCGWMALVCAALMKCASS